MEWQSVIKILKSLESEGVREFWAKQNKIFKEVLFEEPDDGKACPLSGMGTYSWTISQHLESE
ncbi:MAG: hypothetical protein NZM65_07925 [Flavobacteriales bacterium]|nr:hypothetical protein [Flavobacteriales bacterium]MDW8410600.1 hypothetical protein [Flavobacteriales bacterium]